MAALTVLAALLLAVAGCGSGKNSTAGQTRTEPVSRGNLVLTVSTTGNLSVQKQARLTFPTAGAVLEVHAEVGQQVREGQVLARLDGDSLKLAVMEAQEASARTQKALADYGKQFAPEQVEKARASVTSAKASVLETQKALETYLEGFTSEGVAKAASDASSAEATVLQAQQALEKYRESFGPDGVTKAQSSVSSAQASLLQAEQALKDYLDTFSRQGKTKAEAAVASATLALQAAQEALRTAQQPVPGNPAQDARDRLRSAEAEVRNARVAQEGADADLAASKLDWATKQAQAERQIAAAERTYQTQTDLAFGISLNTTELLLKSPQALLPQSAAIPAAVQSAWDALVDRRNNLAVVRLQAQRASALARSAPLDLQLLIAAQDWSSREAQTRQEVSRAEEAYRLAYSDAYRISLTPELLLRSPQELLPQTTTVPAAVQNAWDSLSDARQSLSVVKLQAQKALAVAQNNVLKAKETLEAAQRARAPAEEALQSALAAQRERSRAKELDLELANTALAQATAKLEEARAGPDATQVASLQAPVDAAKVRLREAQQALDDTRAGPTLSELAARQASVDAAKVRLHQAKQALADAKAAPDRNDLAIRQAAIESAKARLQDAQRGLDELMAGPDPLELASRQSATASAELRLQKAKESLERASIKAPFAGVVSVVNVTPGDTVGAATVAVAVVDLNSAEVTAAVDEADVARLKRGQPVIVTTEAVPGARLRGTVKAIAPVARLQQGVVSYDIIIALQPPLPDAVRAGMTMTASIVTENKPNVLLVPLQAVQTSGRDRVVQVMEDGQAVTRTVRVGSSDGRLAEVLEGLSEGEQVVVPIRAVQQGQFRLPAGGLFGGGPPGGGPGGGGGGGAPAPGRTPPTR